MIKEFLSWIRLAVLAVIITVAAVPSPAQAPATSKEERVKAAFIYQFTNYIVWPEKKETVVTVASPFVITVVGKSQLVDELLKLALTKTVKGRPIEIVVIDEPSKIIPSPLVIVNTTDEAVLMKCVAKLKNTPSLIVSQGPGFAKKGAMINFFIDQERLRFEINRAAMAQGNFHVGSQLLSLAKLVD